MLKVSQPWVKKRKKKEEVLSQTGFILSENIIEGLVVKLLKKKDK